MKLFTAVRIFTRNENGRRPVCGGTEKFLADPHWRDDILSHKHYHGDNGAGLDASHQPGWTGFTAKTGQLSGQLDPEQTFRGGKTTTSRQAAGEDTGGRK